MKCTACQLELLDSPREHYKSELHKLNVQRQMYLIPPISPDEFDQEGASSDVSVDISISNITEKNVKVKQKPILENKQKPILENKQKPSVEICLFCDKEESYEHYLEHQMVDEEIFYLMNKTCYVCNEGFTNKKSLRSHLQTENHRTAVIKGNNLVLENGKVIYNKLRSTEISSTTSSRDTSITNFSLKIEFAKDKNIVEKNKLKVSMGMNSQKHFRPDWMQ